MRLSAEAARRCAMESTIMKVPSEIEICERLQSRRSFMDGRGLTGLGAHSRKLRAFGMATAGTRPEKSNWKLHVDGKRGGQRRLEPLVCETGVAGAQLGKSESGGGDKNPQILKLKRADRPSKWAITGAPR